MKKHTTTKISVIGVSLILILFLTFSCVKKAKSLEKDSDDLRLKDCKVERASEWTDAFKRDSGWFGGDGIFSIPYFGDSDSILFVFSDTMVGEIKDKDSLQPGSKMIHNSLAFFDRKKEPSSIEFYTATAENEPATVFEPKNAVENEYYWIGDGFVNHDEKEKLYLFAYRIVNTPHDDSAPFKQVGNDLLIINKSLKTEKQIRLPFYKAVDDSLSISFGSGIYVDQTQVYVYGTRGTEGISKELVAARTSIDSIEDLGSWRFKAKNGWTKDYRKAERLANKVANELSVSKLDNGKYALVYQEGGIFSKIYMRLSTSAYGPFGEKQLIWDTTKDIKDPDLYTYNAKAHPSISKPGELLVTYNVNSSNFLRKIGEKPHLYRPRFIKVIYGKE